MRFFRRSTILLKKEWERYFNGRRGKWTPISSIRKVSPIKSGIPNAEQYIRSTSIIQYRSVAAVDQIVYRGEDVNRDRLKKLAEDERFISGIYNYCDRWCERCPLTSHCLNFSILEEEFSDPEAQDIRNEAFWNKLSEIFEEAMDLLRESAKHWGIELETLDSIDDTENIKAKDAAVKNHLLYRAAKKYSKQVEDWFKERETLFFEMAAAAREGVNLEDAIEVIRWYQYFICAKVMRAVRGSVEEEEEERYDKFPNDSDGSAKIAIIAINRSIAAWAVIQHYITDYNEKVIDIISFLDGLRQAVEETFPKARSFIRPGFDEIEPNG